MSDVKNIVLKPILSKEANAFVKRVHYSGKVVQNSSLHIGVYYMGKLEGVMQFGSPLDKRKVLPLVKDTQWHQMLELNRMAFSEALPRNSESRAIAIAMKIIARHAPQVKWVLSFADATQCGDGAIYRASGFVLTGFSSGSMWKLPPELVELNGGEIAHRMKVEDKVSALSRYILAKTNGKNLTMKRYAEKFGGEVMAGSMLRYIYFIDKSYRERLTVPEIPFSKIKEMGIGMYRGEKQS